MRKTWIVLTVVAVAILLMALPGLAAARGGHGSTSFRLSGTIKALDSGELSIDVTVLSPDSLAGQTITVQTNGDTLFKECYGDQVSFRISFDDLETGSKVRISGVVSDGVYVATRVIQYVEE